MNTPEVKETLSKRSINIIDSQCPHFKTIINK